MSISTHVLDAAHGRPAAGVAVRLARRTADGAYTEVADGRTDADGRLRDWGGTDPGGTAGVYRLTFDTGGYFAARGLATFYPEVAVVFEISEPGAHHHVPLLLSPFAYSTYRGS